MLTHDKGNKLTFSIRSTSSSTLRTKARKANIFDIQAAKLPRPGSDEASSSISEKPKYKHGSILISGRTPMAVTPSWKEDNLKAHYRKHAFAMNRVQISSRESYQKESIALLISDLSAEKPGYIRQYGNEKGDREVGDVVRYESARNLLVVAKKDGTVRTFHVQDQKQPGNTGILAESSDDYERSKK